MEESPSGRKIPFLSPDIREEDLQRTLNSIKSGWLAPGPETKIFEKNLAEFLGIEDTVMLSSCGGALHLSLILAGVKEGDEVITTPISFPATANVVLWEKAKPIFVDVDSETGLIDLSKIEEKITEKTKAIIPVHLYGQMVDMPRLKKLADKYGLKIIEDAAHALGSNYNGIRPGELGFTACFSFQVSKNITSGQGGAIATNNIEIAKRAKILRRYGVVNEIINGTDKRAMVDLGYKYDTSDYQAAMLMGQLARIGENNLKRRRVFQKYAENFDAAGIKFCRFKSLQEHACYLFVIYVDPEKRDEIRKKLSESGIETSIHFLPIHLEPYYKKTFGFKEGDFPVAEKLGASTIALPTYGGLSESDQDYVIKKIIDFCK